MEERNAGGNQEMQDVFVRRKGTRGMVLKFDYETGFVSHYIPDRLAWKLARDIMKGGSVVNPE